MKKIKINAYDYLELNDKAKNKVKEWLDEIPFEYEDYGEIDENGNPVVKNDFASDWEDSDIQEHCESNNFLFDKYGECVHHHLVGRKRFIYKD
tara:strand:+ start:877 stop:1155 length:279 start_codon:yes stop_codon:yes gene_type:complete